MRLQSWNSVKYEVLFNWRNFQANTISRDQHGGTCYDPIYGQMERFNHLTVCKQMPALIEMLVLYSNTWNTQTVEIKLYVWNKNTWRHVSANK